MGLDIISYQKQGGRIAIIDFNEELHHLIFMNPSINWDEYPDLILIKDYYKANATYKDQGLKAIISELEKVKNFIRKEKQFELDKLISFLTYGDIHKIRVTGD